MDGKHLYRGVLMALLKRYYSQGTPRPDPRKNPNPRRPFRTDARTGYGYFFGDRYERREYVTFSPDRSTTRAVWNRMRDLGVFVPDESFDVFHARTLMEADEKGLNRNPRKSRWMARTMNGEKP